MDLYSKFTQHWQEKFAAHIPAQDTFLVAVSGGVDSMVLAHLLLRMGCTIQSDYPLATSFAQVSFRVTVRLKIN